MTVSRDIFKIQRSLGGKPGILIYNEHRTLTCQMHEGHIAYQAYLDLMVEHASHKLYVDATYQECEKILDIHNFIDEPQGW